MADPDKQTTASIPTLLQKAAAHLQAGNLAGAEALAQQILDFNPHFAEALHLLGLAAGQRGDYDRASQFISTAIKDNPQNPIYYCSLALALRKGGQLEKALAAYEQAIQVKPDYAEAHYNRGSVLRDLGRLEAAVAAYRQTIQLQPNIAQVHVDLGYALMELGRPRMALSAYEQAIKLKPDYAEAHYNRGVILAGLGRPKMALAAYEQAIKHKPDYAEAQNNLGTILKEMGRFEEAREAYERTIEFRPDVADIYHNYGVVLRELGRTEEAIEALRTALSLNPELENARYMLAAWGKEQAPKQSPRKYVTELFDVYAENFDHHLTEKLMYNTPQILYQTVTRHIEKAQKLDILDLGCGTGLSGEPYAEVCNRLVGVDLSPQMLAKARKRNIYTELLEMDVNEAMEHIDHTFDLVLAADVFIYVGSLEKVFSLVAERLNPRGLFAFSTETNESSEDYRLRQSGRYAHATFYIQQLADTYGFEELEHSQVILRHENEKPLAGTEFLLRIT